MKFNAGHFTIFSATEREKLHGHQFNVQASIKAEVNESGITFDYGIYKKKLINLCKSLTEIFLIPGNSPHLKIIEEGAYLYLHFHKEKIPFLKKDVLILPIRNITVEELSEWFLNHLIKDQEEINSYGIQEITIKVLSGPGQSASATWSLEK